MKQTAVEFLWNKLEEIRVDLITKSISNEESAKKRAEALQQAKKMDKQQIGEAYEDGYSDSDSTFELNKEYYNDKFQNK